MGLKIHMTCQPIVPTLLKPNTSVPVSPLPPPPPNPASELQGALWLQEGMSHQLKRECRMTVEVVLGDMWGGGAEQGTVPKCNWRGISS